MAWLNEDGQWIVMMGFIVSVSIFTLALVASQAPLVGKTTSESVLEFSKNDIQDLRSEIMTLKNMGLTNNSTLKSQVQNLSIRNNIIVNYSNSTDPIAGTEFVYIHFNNGVTSYSETYEEY